MTDRLLIWMDRELAGRLWLDERRGFCFQYDGEWLARSPIPLSLSLPLTSDPCLDGSSRTWFANLLPEGRIKGRIARRLDIAEDDDFALIRGIAGECSGAVSVMPASDGAPADPPEYRRLSDTELDHIGAKLREQPLLAGQAGIRLCVAGAEKKLPLYYDGSRFSVGLGSAPSTHLIKPPIEGFDGTVENEAFCMALARAVGLDCPASFIHEHGGRRIYVVERYDRIVGDDGIRKLHQEDICQVLRIPPERKNERDGGPSLAASFAIVRSRSSRPEQDLRSLLDWVIFNYLIGNSDTHGKNLSLVLLPGGPVLAPFYDLVSTRVYHQSGMAFNLNAGIGGEFDPDAINGITWERFAGDTEQDTGFVLARVAEMAQRMRGLYLRVFREEFEQYRCDALGRLLRLVHEQTERALRSLRV